LPPKLGGPDLRLREGRRWRELFADFAAQLGHAPNVSEQSLLRSAADLCLAHERMSAEIAGGREIDLDELNRLSGGLRRTLTMLGLTGAAAAAVDRELGEMMQP
jgi:hypothetical protein